ncbi:GAF domain-containing sensor histidine kinase [Galbibacter sp. BG1]
MDNTLDFYIQKDLDTINDSKLLPQILDEVLEITQMGFVCIARMSETQWITSLIKKNIELNIPKGLCLPLSQTICSEVKLSRKPVFIDDLENNPDFSNHSLVVDYGCKSYAALPLYKNNETFFGTLVLMDISPKTFNRYKMKTALQKSIFQISSYLEMKDTIYQLNRELSEERRLAELRDTFIAILGHDLRNPVATTRMISDILIHQKLPEAATNQLKLIKSSSYRMQELIDTILDLAKGHIADGIRLNLVRNKNHLINSLSQVISEAKAIDPSRTFKTTIEIDKSFPCDVDRLGQLLSNLLSNAIKHGNRKDPILIYTGIKFNSFIISVTNTGPRISENVSKNLFKPYYKENSIKNAQGLGLGLYIVSEIAKAHQGTVEVNSNDIQTTFSFKMSIKKLLSKSYSFTKTNTNILEKKMAKV